MSGGGRVTADVAGVQRRCDKLLGAYGPKGLRELSTEAADVLRRDTNAAFASQSDPETGRGWRPPRFPQTHSLLNRSGTLKSLAKQRPKVGDVRAWVKGLIPDGTKLVAYQRRSRTRRTVGRSIGDYVGIGLLHHYGRRDRRLSARRFMGITPGGRSRISSRARQISNSARTS